VLIRRLAVAIAFVLLAAGSVLVFLVLDRSSHSASDTLRPFLITMLPAWIVVLAAAAVLLRKPSEHR
jgi:uncharacterized membrane protein YdcZ (DUF606 family)